MIIKKSHLHVHMLDNDAFFLLVHWKTLCISYTLLLHYLGSILELFSLVQQSKMDSILIENAVISIYLFTYLLIY